MGKASKERYRLELAKAKEAAYKYRNNPFEEGSRIWNMCEKARARKSIMEWMFEEMEEIYGPAGVRRKIIDNAPGSFNGPLVQP